VRTSFRMPVSVALVVLVMSAFPMAAAAMPSEENCAAYRALPFAMAVPDDLRTPGTHRIERYSTFVDEDGNLQEATAENAITINPAADAYTGTVLLRLFVNTTLLPDGEVALIDEMRPDQAAMFYAYAFNIAGEDGFFDSFRMWLRYETTPDTWSPWVEIDPGPLTPLCTQDRVSNWKRSFGWS
jgi:hypothetical protein